MTRFQIGATIAAICVALVAPVAAIFLLPIHEDDRPQQALTHSLDANRIKMALEIHLNDHPNATVPMLTVGGRANLRWKEMPELHATSGYEYTINPKYEGRPLSRCVNRHDLIEVISNGRRIVLHTVAER